LDVFVASPTKAVAKYCDGHVCLCACLCVRTSPEPLVRSLSVFVHVAYGHGSVLLPLGDEMQGDCAI